MKLTMQEAKKTSPVRKALIIAGILAITAMGAFYLFSSGRIVLQGAVSGALVPIHAEMSGQVTVVLVSEGEVVPKGQSLIQLENSALKEAYLREEQARLQMEATLPPHVLADTGPRREELTQRLDQQTLAEQAGRNFLQEASTEEARTAVALRRATILRNKNRISQEQYLETQLAHSRAKHLLETARADQERASLARAETSAELRLLRNASPAGYDQATAALLKAYELQRLKAYAAADALNASIIRSPHAGLVAGITVQPGSAITSGEAALFLVPVSVQPSVIVYATAEEAAKLQPGMLCSVAVPASAAGPFEGEITAVLPGMQVSASAQNKGNEIDDARLLPFRVHVRLSGTDFMTASGNSTAAVPVSLMLMEGSKAEVTVYLHKTVPRGAGVQSATKMGDAASGGTVPKDTPAKTQ